MRTTIKLKLGFAFGAIILMSMATAWLGISSLGAINTTLIELQEGPTQRLQIAQEMFTDIQTIVRAEKNLIIDDRDRIDSYERVINQSRQAFLQNLDKAEAIATPEGRAKWAAIRTLWQRFADANDKLRDAAKRGDVTTARDISLGAGRQTVGETQRQVLEIVELGRRQLKQGQAEAASRYDSARTILFSLVAISMVIALGTAIWISTTISRGLGRAGALAQAVAGGDLTQTIAKPPRDEVGDLIGHVNTMVERLRGVVSEALSAAQNVSSGSQELSASSEQLSQGATEQASSTEEASSSMEEMAANIKQNADNATQTEKIARQSATDAQTSGEAVNRAVDAMRTIAEKITVVQEIARQTDLLALNAAVEAARAGEHGKGFAVVASEVRKLAERSQASAAEISTLSTQTVKVAQEAGEMLVKLVPDIKRTAELVSEISAACREQDIGADQVNQAIQQLDKVTQQNASASEEMSATSEELAAQSEQLQSSISYFRIDDTGAGVRPVPIAPAARRLPAVAPVAHAAVRRPTASAPKPEPRSLAARNGNGHAHEKNGNGFALNLVGANADGRDAEFEKY